MNAPGSIFCKRLAETGGIDELGIRGDITNCVVGQGAFLLLGGSKLTWSRCNGAAVKSQI